MEMKEKLEKVKASELELLEIKKQVQEQEKIVANEWMEIRKAILSGETTGSIAKDFVIVRKSFLDNDLIVALDYIAEDLKNNKGQLFLFIEHKKERFVYRDP